MIIFPGLSNDWLAKSLMAARFKGKSDKRVASIYVTDLSLLNIVLELYKLFITGIMNTGINFIKS